MNTQVNYSNVITFPEGKPYTITSGKNLMYSLSNMHIALDDMEDVFAQLLNSLRNEEF